MEESAPLLHDITSDDQEHGLTPVRRSRVPPTAVKALRILTLVLSISLLGLVIANIILVENGPFQYTWNTKHETKAFMKWMIPVVIISFINVIVRIPWLLNVIPDITFSVGIIVCLVGFMNEFPHQQWCEGRRYPKPEPPDPRCPSQKLNVTIIMGVASGLGIILAATYISLLCLKAFDLSLEALDIYRSNAWNKAGLTLPSGGVTWSINLNVIRDENETSIGISAGSRKIPSDRGPVHL